MAAPGHRPAHARADRDQVQLGTTVALGPARLSHLGEVAGAPGQVRFRFESELHGAALVRVMRDLLASILAEVAVSELPEQYITDGDRRGIIQVETDSATLRPSHALFETKTSLRFKDGKEVRDAERRDDTFHWDKAEGACAAKP